MTLRLILGDQLNAQHSWYAQTDPNTLYVMLETRSETDYVPHHIQKVVAFFCAMRQFADSLRQAGHTVEYFALDANPYRNFTDAVVGLCAKHNCTHFDYQMPDEYRLDAEFSALSVLLHTQNITTQAYDTEHFMTTRYELRDFFVGKKTYLMESFYRAQRKKYRILMDYNDQPLTGKWNYDSENRNKYDGKTPIPAPLYFERDVTDVVEMLQTQNVKTIGNIDAKNLKWATNRREAEQLLSFFCDALLPNFGKYQDAMTKQHWALFHCRLSFCMNAKIISPMEVVQAAIDAWQAAPDTIGYGDLEGFVRQIVGWREYMRGVYWARMPDYASLNFFENTRPLPSWFWTGDTKMNCLKYAIKQSLDHAYAHHIQRLMVTGNFALLTGIAPAALDEWYLGIYIDAIEWVEITNTRGMSQFADGGLVGTKPYCSSANYIDKMTDYCSGCFYDKKLRTGAKACPFNSLYWHFYDRNRALLAKNPRIGMAYVTLNKMDADTHAAILAQAEQYLADIESL